MDLDLQSLFGLHVTRCTQLYSLPETPQIPYPHIPGIWTRIRGRYWSGKIDDISLWLPGRLAAAELSGSLPLLKFLHAFLSRPRPVGRKRTVRLAASAAISSQWTCSVPPATPPPESVSGRLNPPRLWADTSSPENTTVRYVFISRYPYEIVYRA